MLQIVKQLLGKTVPWEQAQSMLEDLFVKSKRLKPVIMLIDEVNIRPSIYACITNGTVF